MDNNNNSNSNSNKGSTLNHIDNYVFKLDTIKMHNDKQVFTDIGTYMIYLHCSPEYIIESCIIGLDQSYSDTGISVIINGELELITHLTFEDCWNDTEKRFLLCKTLYNLLGYISLHMEDLAPIQVIYERIRLISSGFLSMDYIMNISAMCMRIVDVCHIFNTNRVNTNFLKLFTHCSIFFKIVNWAYSVAYAALGMFSLF